ncbi:hypothetical protein ACHAQJ_004173 [Trichoderma viride]
MENIEKSSAIEGEEINTAATTYEGSFEDRDKSFAAIGSRNHHTKFPYDTPEDSACSSHESLGRTSLASRKRKNTRRTGAKESQYGTKSPEKQKNLFQPVSGSENENGSSLSMYSASDVSETSGTSNSQSEAEWMISKLERLQKSLDKQLQKAVDKLHSDRSSFMQLHRAHRYPSSASQPDTVDTTEVQPSLTNSSMSISSPSSNCKEDLDMQPSESHSRPLPRPPNSQPMLSPPATVTSEALSSHLPTFLSGSSLPLVHSPLSPLPVPPNHLPPPLILHPAITGRGQDADIEKANEKGRGSPRFRRLDRAWDASKQKFMMKKLAKELEHDATQDDDCIFIVRRDFNCVGKHIETAIEIKNNLFKECLQHVIGNITGVNLAEENPKLDPKSLFLYLDDFRSYYKVLAQVKPYSKTTHGPKRKWKVTFAKRRCLRVLINYLEEDFAETEKNLKLMLGDGVITFDLLWALWKPSTLIYSPTYRCHDIPTVSMLTFAERRKKPFSEDFEYSAETQFIDFNGKTLTYKSLKKEIRRFNGAVKITSLPFYPLRYHKDEAEIRSLLIERGTKFVSLQGVHHKSFTGIAFQLAGDTNETTTEFDEEQHRIMIDPVGFRRVYPKFFESLDLPAQYTNDDETFNDGVQPQHLIELLATKKGEDDGQSIEGNAPSSEDSFSGDAYSYRENEEKTRLEKVKNNLLLLCCPVIVGYSLERLEWLEFDVRGIEDIKWNDESWDSLVLEQKTKELIEASVASHVSNPALTLDDNVPTKRKGLTIVLHGPPGTGKTLTVEGLSDHLRRPLLVMSARELGCCATSIDAILQKLLAACHSWGAIVVIDDATVLLEKCDFFGTERSALVAVVSRHLESFQGILFLTCNSIRSFDEAYQSRIDFAHKYDKPDKRGKRAMFKRALDRARVLGRWVVGAFDDEDYNMLVESDLNGREINTVVGLALSLAEAREEAVGVGHLQEIMDMQEQFRRDFRGMDQRSYFS